MTEMVCYIEYDEIVDGSVIIDGPFDILKKKSYRNISGPYLLTEQQRFDVGLWPYVDAPPGYDIDIQYLTSEDVVGEDVVTKTYMVNDYTSEEMDARIADAKVSKKATVRSLARQNTIQQYADWVSTEDDAIDAFSTLAQIRDHESNEPDYEVIAIKQSAARDAIIASNFANKTYAQVDTYIEDNVIDLASAKDVIKTLAKLLVAVLKRQDWSE